MAEELKPCPFCGSSNVKLCEDQNFVYYGGAYFVECRECKASSKTSDETETIAAWNNRKGEAE